jgi:hypothetical protein
MAELTSATRPCYTTLPDVTIARVPSDRPTPKSSVFARGSGHATAHSERLLPSTPLAAAKHGVAACAGTAARPSRRWPEARLRRPRVAASLWGEVQQMKRRIAVVALVFVAFALIAQQALAVSPHFIRASGSLESNGALTVDFKEAGLGTNQNINYTLTAQATATYVCVSTGAAATPAPQTRPPSLAR